MHILNLFLITKATFEWMDTVFCSLHYTYQISLINTHTYECRHSPFAHHVLKSSILLYYQTLSRTMDCFQLLTITKDIEMNLHTDIAIDMFSMILIDYCLVKGILMPKVFYTHGQISKNTVSIYTL